MTLRHIDLCARVATLETERDAWKDAFERNGGSIQILAAEADRLRARVVELERESAEHRQGADQWHDRAKAAIRERDNLHVQQATLVSALREFLKAWDVWSKGGVAPVFPVVERLRALVDTEKGGDHVQPAKEEPQR